MKTPSVRKKRKPLFDEKSGKVWTPRAYEALLKGLEAFNKAEKKLRMSK